MLGSRSRSWSDRRMMPDDTMLAPTAIEPAEAGPPRARGAVRIGIKSDGGTSRLRDLRQSGSMRVLFPRPGTPPTAMLLNTAGGITGGDAFSIEIDVDAHAEATITTQAAERAYAALDGPPGRLETRLQAGHGAQLRWLPQETILFQDAHLRRSLDVDLGAGAEALIVEPVVFGRPAHGETLHNATFRDRIRIRQEGRLTLAEDVHLEGDVAAHMAHPAVGGGAGAMAILILAGPRAAAQLDPLREKSDEISGTSAGVSLITEELLALRALAHDSFHLRQLLLPILDHLTGDRLPICWRL